MGFGLNARERKALENLRYECDYDRENYIVKGKLGVGVGEKTLTELEQSGLIKSGVCNWSRKKGFRITDAGRAAIEHPSPSKPPSSQPRLRLASPRVGTLKSRLDD